MSTISGIGGGYNSSNLYGKIASGNRIQRAADDAAGMAIASKMEAQSRSLNMQARNASEQRAALNVADGGRSGISDYLQDISELSIQAMNGTMSASDKQIIQNQINQYTQGIADTVHQTKYNETYMLSGTSAESLGMAGYNVTAENFNLDDVSSALSSVNASRSQDGAMTNGLSSNISNLQSTAENTTAAMSRISDLDIGKASTELKKEQALQQYSAAMQKRQMDDQQSLMAKMFA
ncbi:MAG: flagellin FliC5 [Lachnospiraceae bacterium]|nr:flagellin FliC5 [Lachnospiraceae bacterium]